MLSWIVGNVDVPAAAVLIAFFIGLGIVVTTFLTTHKSKDDRDLERLKLQNDAEVQKRRDDQAHESALAKIASNREIEFKRVDANMITSHSSSTASE